MEVSQQLRANTRQFERVNQELAAFRNVPPQASQSEERLNNVELAVSKVKPWKTLLGFVGFLIVGAIAVWTALGNYAKDRVVETVKAAHADPENPIEPSVKTVTEMKGDIQQANVAADYLFRQKELDVQIQEVKIELEIHLQQHQERMQEWSAQKAARRTTKEKPIKTDRHVELEAKLKTLNQEQLKLEPKKPEAL